MMDSIKTKHDDVCPNEGELSAYVDRQLAAAAARAVAAHLQACDACSENVTAIENLSRAFRALPQVAVGSDITPRIELAVARAVRQQRIARAWRLAPLSLAAAATVVLGVFIGTMLATTPRVHENAVPMAMFDAIPPGSVCIGFESCYPRGKI